MSGTGILEGKVAVVTGAGSGIGKGIAEVFVREGAKVVVVDFSGDQDKVAAALGENAVPFQADLRDEGDIKGMFRKAIDTWGRVDALVNNAGTVGGARPDMDYAYYDRMSEVNLRSVMFACQHGIQAMLQTGGGSIVNVSSVSSLNTEGRTCYVYMASKAGVNSLTKAYAVRYGEQGIRVNAIAPGFTMTEKQQSHLPPQVMADMSAKAALNRPGTTHEQAEVAAFLASDRSSFVSGVVIPVDGGWSAKMV